MPKLKVYRTPTGFHDAYVAAPSQKAALEAWGSEHNLFARGVAEVVTDPAITKEPLKKPGVVIKRLRGTAAEQIAALPPDNPSNEQRLGTAKALPRSKAARKKAPPKPKPTPPPDRAELQEAERELAAAEVQHASEMKAIAEKEAALARERRTLEKGHAAWLSRLQRQRDKAKAAYERAVSRWRG